MTPFTQCFEDLPNSLPVFPLKNAVLMPGGRLPLNIFEPRYLEMVQDAMKGDQLIGMIQPSDQLSPPSLHRVGCVGRVTQYEETDDGRLGVLLLGLCRFTITEELTSIRDYRIIIPGWSDFADDYLPSSSPSTRTTLLFKGSLRHYLKYNNIEADWHSLEQLNIRDLTNSVLGYLPLTTEDKQLLIETDTLDNRLIAFTAILDGDANASSVQH